MKAMPLALTIAGLMLYGLGGVYIGTPDGGFYWLRALVPLTIGAALVSAGIWLAWRRR